MYAEQSARYRRKLRAEAARICGRYEAEDVVEEALLQTVSSGREFTTAEQFVRYWRVATRHLAIDARKKQEIARLAVPAALEPASEWSGRGCMHPCSNMPCSKQIWLEQCGCPRIEACPEELAAGLELELLPPSCSVTHTAAWAERMNCMGDGLAPELNVDVVLKPLMDLIHATERQRQVARLLAAGYTEAEIAGQLGIRQATVCGHRGALCRNLERHGQGQDAQELLDLPAPLSPLPARPRNTTPHDPNNRLEN